MTDWLHQRVLALKGKHADLYFPRRAAINWMESLARVIDLNGEFKKKSLKKRFQNSGRRAANKSADTVTLANIFSAAQYLDSLKVMSGLNKNRDRLARIAIVDWYYGIYWASNAMLAAKTGTHPETHASAAATWYRQIASPHGGIGLPEPFNFGVETLVERTYREYIDSTFGSSTRVTDFRYVDASNARSNCIGSLLGSADYWREVRENEVRKYKEFKNAGFSDFKKKDARLLRDTTLAKHCCGFLHQAYRFRGKANYRDCLYFGYDEESRSATKGFVQTMEAVLSSYLLMASCYVIAKIEKGIWKNFLDDLEGNSWLTSETLSLLDIA